MKTHRIPNTLRFVPALLLIAAFAPPALSAGETPAPLTIPVNIQPPDGYPANPSALLTPLRQDLKDVHLARRADGRYDLTLGSGPEAPSVAGVDLRTFIPRIPDIARGDDRLTRIALAQREFNRNEVSFGAVTGADDLKLANNCLRAGLWEIMLSKKIEGTSKLTYHGWFTFPRDEYARLFEEVNGMPYARFEKELAAYPAMGGFEVPLAALRKEGAAAPVATPGTGLERVSDTPALRFGEQTRKAKLVLTDGITTYGGFQDPARQPVVLARFSEPGLYNPADPMRFDLGWMARPKSAAWRSVTSRQGGHALTEVALAFENGYRIVVGDEGLAKLPARSEPPKADGDVLRLTFGLSTPEISLPVADRAAEFSAPRSNYLFLLDSRGKAVDNHMTGVDRVFLWREAGANGADRLHVLLVSYERIAIVGEIVLPWRVEPVPVASN